MNFKLTVKRLTAIIISAISVITFTGCQKSFFKSVYDDYQNLAENIILYNAEMKKLHSFSVKDDKSNYVSVDLGKETAFNTITLGEKEKSITLFSIYASNKLDSDYDFIYQGDTVEKTRTCFVGSLTYRYLRIFVSGFSGKYNLNKIGVYNIKNAKTEKLRVSAYLVADSLSEKSDLSMLNCITDVILFGIAYFDAQGNIKFYNNSTETNDEIYTEKINILKKAIGGRNINIIADIHFPQAQDNTAAVSMMNENCQNTINNIKNFIEKYGFDGYDIDYEYPYTNNEWKLYNNFLREIKKAVPNKILSVAIAPWGLKFDKDVAALIDRAEVMLYDGFDSHGYHSTFPYAAQGVQTVLEAGFKKSQIDLGLPFYSRPVNKHAFWGSYKDFAEKMGRYNNLINYDGFDHENRPLKSPQYLNSCQMIADKTAFAIDAGLGGLMIWHLACDLPYNNPLSLCKTINDTIEAKQA